jgi:hypothetical protein
MRACLLISNIVRKSSHVMRIHRFKLTEAEGDILRISRCEVLARRLVVFGVLEPERIELVRILVIVPVELVRHRGDSDNGSGWDVGAVAERVRLERHPLHCHFKPASTHTVSGQFENRRQLTAGNGIGAIALAEERVKLDHPLHGRLGHALFSDDSLDLLAERLDPFRLGGKGVECMCPGLFAYFQSN